MLMPFNSPINGQADTALPGQLVKRLQQHRIGQMAGFQARVMEQARQAFAGSFLVAKASGQLSLTATLTFDDGGDKALKGFTLVTMCPRQHKRDILAQTSSSGVLMFHNPRLAQRRKPWLLVTLQNVSRLQGSMPIFVTQPSRRYRFNNGVLEGIKNEMLYDDVHKWGRLLLYGKAI
jgi:hypothetical protein